jgi:hypothetical protein
MVVEIEKVQVDQGVLGFVNVGSLSSSVIEIISSMDQQSGASCGHDE